MSGDLSDDVDAFIGGLSSDDSPPERPKRQRRAARPPEPEEPAEPLQGHAKVAADRARENEEREEEETAVAVLPAELPRPNETRRTLASIMSKYGVGLDPNFSVQLRRTLPKYHPGGIQAHGFLAAYREPITEEFITAEYQGGTYSVEIYGPDPKHPPNGQRLYETISVEISGPANPDHLPKSVREKLNSAALPPVAIVGPPATSQENPTLAASAMKMAQEFAERERAERHRAEDKQGGDIASMEKMYAPVLAANERRTEDVLRAEREKSAAERSHLEERLRESRDDQRRLEAKVEAMSTNGNGTVESLKELIPLLKGDSQAADAAAHAATAAAKASENITNRILDRQKSDMEAVHKQHQTMLESIRASHLSEMASMREANARQIESERESGILRERRHEESLRVEREERRRDMEQYKKTADDRDVQWRDRMEQQEINLKTMWESRVETQKSNYESQLQWMRSETEQLQSRVRELQTAVGNQGDLVTQLGKMRDIRAGVKDALGIDDSPPPPPSGGPGGIGLSGSDGPGDWKSMVETVVENIAPIMQTMGWGPQGQQQQNVQQQPQQQRQYQPGDIVQMPQGVMIVVNTPEGLRFTPKDQFDAYQAQQRSTSKQLAPGQQRQRGMMAPVKPSSGIPVPNMAEGLPKPPVWGEPVQPPMPQAQPQQPPPQQQRQQAPAQQQRPQQQGGMDKQQQQIANELAKLIHNSVEGGDEPEEFVEKMLNSPYPPAVRDAIIKTLTAMSDDQIIASIRAVQPNSAGATPMGQRFIHEAMAALRASI